MVQYLAPLRYLILQLSVSFPVFPSTSSYLHLSLSLSLPLSVSLVQVTVATAGSPPQCYQRFDLSVDWDVLRLFNFHVRVFEAHSVQKLAMLLCAGC
jgi:hypothetical protein